MSIQKGCCLDLPYKDRRKQNAYMREYMKARRAIERQIIQEFKFKFPKVADQIYKELGFSRRKRKRGKKK